VLPELKGISIGNIRYGLGHTPGCFSEREVAWNETKRTPVQQNLLFIFSATLTTFAETIH